MSIKLMARVWEAELKSTDKFVLLALADHANDDGECYPSLSKIQSKTGLSRQGLLNVIDRLESLGFIQREHRQRENGSHTSNLYTINPNGVVNDVDKVVNEVDMGSQHSGLGVVNDVDKVVNEVDSHNHHNNHKDKPSDKSSLKSEPLPDCIDPEKWAEWIAYRKKRRLTCVEETLTGQIKKLEKWAAAGHNPSEIIQHSLDNGYQGLFEPKGKPKNAMKWGGINDQDGYGLPEEFKGFGDASAILGAVNENRNAF